MSLFESALEGFLLAFSWPNILYPIVGTLLTMLFAFLPGLSGLTLMALAIPLTIGWDLLPVMLLFGAFVGGATFMGSVTAILFNVPGTAPSAATLLDGYPMALRGEAKAAIACAASASALGSTFGIVLLIAALPIVQGLILAFGPLEFLLLTVWGLTTVAIVSHGTWIKGLATGGLGMMLAFIGLDPRTAELRYTFGSDYLIEGLSPVPVLLGLFGVSEMLDLMVSGRRTIAGVASVRELAGGTREGLFAVFRHFGLFLRCSTIGTVLGLIPGIGATVASFIAYAHAMHSAKDEGRFGAGDIRGVLAPEACHDAKDGGSLLPTLAFGLPGSEASALLLAAITLHGLTPGRELMGAYLPIVFALIWSLFLSNWLTSILGLAVSGPITRLTVVRLDLLVPLILVMVAVGAVTYRGLLEDLALVAAFGIFGYYLKKHGWPRVPFVIALVITPLFETNLHLTLRLYELGRLNLLDRPIAGVLVLLILMTLLVPFRRRHGWAALR